MLASDLILILVRAFRSTATTCIEHPEQKYIARAAGMRSFDRTMIDKEVEESKNLMPGSRDELRDKTAKIQETIAARLKPREYR